METANYLCNRLPTKTRGHGEVIPGEKWWGSCQNLSHLCIFGNEVLIDIPKEKRIKTDIQQVLRGILIGYSNKPGPQKQSKSLLSAIHLSMNPYKVLNYCLTGNLKQAPAQSEKPPASQNHKENRERFLFFSKISFPLLKANNQCQ